VEYFERENVYVQQLLGQVPELYRYIALLYTHILM